MTTKAERAKRLDIVEQAMRAEGWSGALLRRLQRQLGVTERTVHRLRKDVLEEIAKGYRGPTREQERAEFIDRLRDHQRAARDAGKFGPIGSMMAIEAKVRGFDQNAGVPSAPVRVVIEGVPGWGSEGGGGGSD